MGDSDAVARRIAELEAELATFKTPFKVGDRVLIVGTVVRDLDNDGEHYVLHDSGRYAYYRPEHMTNLGARK